VLGFLLERLVRSVLTIWFVVTLVFFGIRVSGDPAQMMLGDAAPPEAIEAYRQAMGLNDSTFTQYRRYLSSLLHGDFGKSLVDPRPVTQIVWDRLPLTLQLMAISLLLALAIGIPIGVLVALRRDSAFDRAVITFCLLGQSMPAFLIAILMIFAFSVGLRWLPSSGHGGWSHFVMPVATLTWGALATIARLTRSSVLEALRQDYVRTARAKGIRERGVMVFHVLRNAAIPLATMVGFLVSAAIAGSVIVETVFAWPGMGRLVSGSVNGRDYPVLQFAVLLITGTVVTVNFLVDIAYGLLDPRIRIQNR
jgi:peptide/nickel transport system permease protein